MSLAFVPPKEETKSLPRYASYVVGSGMKVHGRLVDAKNSWRNRGWHYVQTGELVETFGRMRPETKHVTKHAFILENVNGSWFVLYEIKPGLTEEELPWMKEYLYDGWSWRPYSDYMRENKYYQEKLADGSYRIKKRPTSMSTDEYVAWRIQVELESRGIISAN